MSDMVHAGNAIIVSDHFVVIRDDEYVEAVLLVLRDFDPEAAYTAYCADSKMIPDFVEYLVAERYVRRIGFSYLTMHPNVAGEAGWMRSGE